MSNGSFSIGLFTFITPIFIIILYLFSYIIKNFGAYINRKSPPNERVIWVIVIFIIIGVIFGSFLQRMWEVSNKVCGNYKKIEFLQCALFQQSSK